MKEKIIGILISVINNLENIISDSVDSEIQLLKQDIRKVSVNNQHLLNINIDRVSELCPRLDVIDVSHLKFYQGILSLGRNLGDYEKGKIKNILAKVNTFLFDYDKKNTENIKNSKEKLKKCNDLLAVIKDDGILSSHDIDLMYELLHDNNVDINEAISIMRFIAISSIDGFALEDKDEDDLEEHEEYEESNNNVDDLITLFNKYGSNFKLFTEEEQEKIIKYGNIEKITEIFEALKKNNILSIDIHLKKRSKTLCRMFLKSNSELVGSIFDVCKKYGIASTGNFVDFGILLEKPSKFFKSKKRKKRKEPGTIVTPPGGGGPFPELENDEYGLHDDFIQNVEFFANQGVDVGVAYKKCPFCFDISHEHIKTGVKNLELYGIGSLNYLNSLSCFGTRNQADAIDLFIELGYFNYIKNNLSRTLLPVNSPVFYRIARANQLGELVWSNKNSTTLKLDVTNLNSSFLGIDKENGSSVVGQYNPTFARSKEYEFALSKSDNNTTTLSESDEIIKKLDERYLIDGEPPVYLIGGVRISKIKVLRLYNTLKLNSLSDTQDSLMFAITRNSILTREQFINISREISELFYERDRSNVRRILI